VIVKDGPRHKGRRAVCGQRSAASADCTTPSIRKSTEEAPVAPVRVARAWTSSRRGATGLLVVRISKRPARPATLRREGAAKKTTAQRGKVQLVQGFEHGRNETGGVQELPVIIKADTPRSLEAIKGEITTISASGRAGQCACKPGGGLGVNESGTSTWPARREAICSVPRRAERPASSSPKARERE